MNNTMPQQKNTANSFPVCTLTSAELTDFDSSLDPCLLEDLNPNATSTITILSVTASSCYSARDGPRVAVERLNSLNENRGFAIGYLPSQTFVKFRLIEIVAGSRDILGKNYNNVHEEVFRKALNLYQPDYITGTCSQAASAEKEPAREYETFLFSMVGPPGFYRDENPWLFGIHLNSNEYVSEAVHQLDQLHDEEKRKNFPINVIHRTESEFFFETCQTAVDRLKDLGFRNVTQFLFEPFGDDDSDNVTNTKDEDFWNAVVDQTCPSGVSADLGFHPSFFLCTADGEHDRTADRLLQNGCLPTSIWQTATAFKWAHLHPDKVPYLMGGAQWHESVRFADEFFESGQDMLQEAHRRFGAVPHYNTVVTYATIMLMRSHLEAAYATVDFPDPVGDFKNPVRRENLRRQLRLLQADTIFGPIRFDPIYQRNIGRDAVGLQWLPAEDNSFKQRIVSPRDQSEANVVIPVASALPCSAGSFFNKWLFQTETSVLSSKCSLCPLNTFTPEPSWAPVCTICEPGATTEEQGSSSCVCEDCIVPYELEFAPLGMGSPGCSRAELCSSVEQIGSIEFRATDNLRRPNISVSVLFSVDKIVDEHTMSRIGDTNQFELIYNFSGLPVGVLLADVFVDGDPIDQNPLRLSVLPRDCERDTGDKRRTPDAHGTCVCEEGSFSYRSAKCLSSTLVSLSIVLPIVVIGGLCLLALLFKRRRRSHAMAQWRLENNHLDISSPVEVLGTGTFGPVVAAKYRGTQVAVKVLWPNRSYDTKRSVAECWRRPWMKDRSCLSNEDMFLGLSRRTLAKREASLANELNLLAEMRHPCKFKANPKSKLNFVSQSNIFQYSKGLVTIIGTISSVRDRETRLVMELMEYGSLEDMLQNDSIVMDEEIRISLMRDVASGLSFLHAKKPNAIVHGNLEPKKILVDAHCHAKLSGFGLSRWKVDPKEPDTSSHHDSSPTLRFALTSSPRKSTSSDIHAFGCVLCALYSGGGATLDQQDFKEKWDSRTQIVPEGCPLAMAETMLDCFRSEESRRPTAVDILGRLESLLKTLEAKRVQNMGDHRATDLLNDIFPPHVAAALQEGRKIEPEHHDIVTIFFSGKFVRWSY